MERPRRGGVALLQPSPPEQPWLMSCCVMRCRGGLQVSFELAPAGCSTPTPTPRRGGTTRRLLPTAQRAKAACRGTSDRQKPRAIAPARGLLRLQPVRAGRYRKHQPNAIISVLKPDAGRAPKGSDSWSKCPGSRPLPLGLTQARGASAECGVRRIICARQAGLEVMRVLT